jgi:hypothetical protein
LRPLGAAAIDLNERSGGPGVLFNGESVALLLADMRRRLALVIDLDEARPDRVRRDLSVLDRAGHIFLASITGCEERMSRTSDANLPTAPELKAPFSN